MNPEPDRLRASVERLAPIERLSASEGERAAAGWIRDELAALGVAARIEEERAHGTYWMPLGLLSAAAAVAGLASRRATGTIVGALSALALADDVSGGPPLVPRGAPPAPAHQRLAPGGGPPAARPPGGVA